MKTNTIPPMTDPLGAYWRQPNREEILLDDKHALMGLRAFNTLAEYSRSQPSGVYPGKMWKREWQGRWWLCWFGEHPNPELCSNHHREILVV